MKTAKQIDNQTCELKFNSESSEEFYDILNSVKQLYGRKFLPDRKVWQAPITKSNIEDLAKIGFDIEESILTQLYQKKEIKIDETKLNHHLFPFQKEDVKRMEELDGRVLLANEMGLGKTIEAIEYLNLHPELRPALVICPASLKENWARECKKWLRNKEKIFVVSSKTIIDVDNECNIFIINYDILEKMQESISEIIRPKITILDECHKIKNGKAKRTKSAKLICKTCDKIIAISGTPIVNRPVEFWNTLNLLNPVLFKSFWYFAQRYCDAKQNHWGWDFGGASNLDELNSVLLENIMIRKLKKDVLKDLPEKIRTVIPITTDNGKEYEEGENRFTNWLMENRSAKQPNILAQIEQLKQLAFKLKFDDLREWIEDYLESGRKLVVFCTHHFAIDAIAEAFPEMTLKLDGRTPMKDRQEIVDKFQNDDKYKLFLGNIQAAGVGLTLTAADSCLFAELAWTPGDHTQAEDRIHRIGQKNSVNIYYMISTGTIEEDIMEVIDQKRMNLDKALDGKETESENILSLILKKFLSKDRVA